MSQQPPFIPLFCNAQKQFVPLIESGEKRQTIRSRKRPIKVGDLLYLYTGQRTKSCRKIAESICTKTHDFQISKYQVDLYPRAWIDGELICSLHLKELALRDGFKEVEDFIQFFLQSPKAQTESCVTSFSGQIIKWGMLCKL
ncbi:ASCH domain-containing protein [[Leptolyngbya] sp. PCC 7376]|uniref:ASCH domain-containing protein n=1 Tax=[Leptolyngbya] sp. PCC 7376 TaxID=111781 RepID=UPI0005A06143|nr:ASCH domain-containing protein [[Leptolyngbya] sp. PCC 7376]